MTRPGDHVLVEAADLDAILAALRGRGYTLLGPSLRDGAIVYAEIQGAADLPAGWTDEQEGGRYRLRPRGDRALFGYAPGPHSWKRYLHPPSLVLWRARRGPEGLETEPGDAQPPRYAFVGVRPCELAAIRVQDRVFLGGPCVDPAYRRRRENAFLLAVNCSEPGGTCFCASMRTGPRAAEGFDLALTELLDESRHVFLVEAGSPEGASLLDEVESAPAADADLQAAREVTRRAEGRMGRGLDTTGLRQALLNRYEDPRWDELAQRCLACGNCTLVCPTCFCATIEDETDLAGEWTERRRVWDSCFSQEFSYIHGGSVRSSGAARYRQWITHKLATWQDQFGTLGCVGCGRCITWCPVGIDITAEARAVCEAEAKGRPA